VEYQRLFSVELCTVMVTVRSGKEIQAKAPTLPHFVFSLKPMINHLQLKLELKLI
jgi:hypothetical protein